MNDNDHDMTCILLHIDEAEYSSFDARTHGIKCHTQIPN